MTAVDRNGLEILDRAQCMGLLADVTVGRLAYARGGVPAVVPVNVALVDERILFRLGTGAALAAIYDRQVIALEVDEIDADGRRGWSINVVGNPTEISVAVAGHAGVALQSWLRADNSRLFSLATNHVKGRRLCPGPGGSTRR